MTVTLIDHNRDNQKEFESRAEAEEKRNDIISMGASPEDLEIVSDTSDTATEVADGGQDTMEAKPVETPSEPTDTQPIDVDQLSQNPIDFLEAVNDEFVNTIKGTPAISKRGFRYIQREFGITTEAEVVETFDDPTGVIVWAKASLPNGHSAEAHGEGYLTESMVDDNEFVRYADTRAKNRALSDLTSAGALAVSELSKE